MFAVIKSGLKKDSNSFRLFTFNPLEYFSFIFSSFQQIMVDITRSNLKEQSGLNFSKSQKTFDKHRMLIKNVIQRIVAIIFEVYSMSSEKCYFKKV